MSDQSGKDGDGAESRPATYRQVFDSREFRGVYSAGALSSIGDFLGKAALAALVFQATDSALASAGALALTYLPWLAGAPFLVALAERLPYRRVMLTSDICRFLLVGVAAIPGLPVALVPVLMFLAAVLTPPFDASRSALLPTILRGDRYVLGLSLRSMTDQAMQVAGFVLGGALSIIDPRMALGVDALTFLASATLIFGLVSPRPPVARSDTGRNLLRETGAGFALVFGHRVLRAIAVIVFSGVAFAILPEGLAAAWSGHLHTGSLGQGLIMAGMPVGIVIGGIVIGRLTAPAFRQRLIRPLAILLPISLVAALFDPPLPVVVLLAVITGFASSVVLPANGLFVQVLPNAYRARAFGVMQGGLEVMQGAVMIIGGLIASQIGVPTAVGIWALFGVLVMVLASVLWPKPAVIDAAIERARRDNEEAEGGSPQPETSAERTERSSDTGRDAASVVEQA